MPVQIRPVSDQHERRLFLTFPWRIYAGDPVWVPPLLAEQEKAIDPKRGAFFADGCAELFIAWKDGKPAGTLCLAEDRNYTRTKGTPECMLNYVEVIYDYSVFESMLDFAAGWAREKGMRSLYGPFYLDREDRRGLLIEGRDRPAPILCGHQPTYYQGFYERYGFSKDGEDLLAYAFDLDPAAPRLQRLLRLAGQVCQRHPQFTVRTANLDDIDNELERIVYLQNHALKHFSNHVPYTRNDIEAMIRPLLDVVDIDLVLFAEVDGQPAGFLPGVPNFNELIIKLNGLRYPWDTLRYVWHRKHKPECLAVKSAVVSPEYWDTGVAVLLFAELARRAIAKGYKWADLSMTGEDNPDTRPLARHIGAKVYKRYRFYRKEL